MFDCHADLLTFIYINRNNLRKIKDVCKNLYNKNNITGAIFNLFFMSEKEMEEELGINKGEIDVINMLKIVDCILKENDILPKNMKYFYGIEGLDYLKNISDIDILYDLGVRSTTITWNNENKFGGGIKSDSRLSTIGAQLVEKLIEKNIKIDLSHANEKTFFDIVNKCNELKNKGYKPKIFVSHSNLKSVCSNIRNISDEQANIIRKFGGIIGLVEYKKFISSDDNYEEKFIEHIKHLKELFGDVKNIALSTDDEIFYNKKLEKSNLYNSVEVCEKIKRLLLDNGFKLKEVNAILYENAYRFLYK